SPKMAPQRFIKKFLKVKKTTKHFNAVALHPYASKINEHKARVSKFRKALDRGGAKKEADLADRGGLGLGKQRPAPERGARRPGEAPQEVVFGHVEEAQDVEDQPGVLVRLARSGGRRAGHLQLLSLGGAGEARREPQAVVQALQALREEAGGARSRRAILFEVNPDRDLGVLDGDRG